MDWAPRSRSPPYSLYLTHLWNPEPSTDDNREGIFPCLQGTDSSWSQGRQGTVGGGGRGEK